MGLMAKKSRWTMPTPILEVVADVEAAEVMIVMIAVKEVDSVVVEEAVEVLVEAGAAEAAAATTATKKVILPENAPRETVVAMADPNTKMGLTRNPINFSCLDVIKKMFQNLKIIIK